jgi:hypothetical protein
MFAGIIYLIYLSNIQIGWGRGGWRGGGGDEVLGYYSTPHGGHAKSILGPLHQLT